MHCRPDPPPSPPLHLHPRFRDRADAYACGPNAVRTIRISDAANGKEPFQMSEQRTSEASLDDFDGEAISRADREFLSSLDDHPLARHPLYSVPPPPRPDYAGCTTVAERAAAQKARFPAALDWLLINYAYYADAFMGKGGIISLVDGKIGTIGSLKGFMQLYAIVEEGPRGGLKKTSVVDVWISHPSRAHI